MLIRALFVSMLATITLPAFAQTAVVSALAEGPTCGEALNAPLAQLDGETLLVRAPLALSVGPVPQGQAAFAEGQCTHTITLKIPDGKQVAVRGVRYYAHLNLTQSAGAFHSVEIWNVGLPGTLARSTPGVAGPTAGYRKTVHTFEERDLLWTGCGGEVQVGLRERGTVRAQGGNRGSLLIVGNWQGQPSLALDLVTRDCR